MLTIMCISDVENWDCYKKYLDKISPDIVILAGDLISDGFASFWDDALERIEEFRYERELLKSNFKIKENKNGFYEGKNIAQFQKKLQEIKQKYRKTKYFDKLQWEMHSKKFYDFLEYASKKSDILVIKGDHDNDFKDIYSIKKINDIERCKEISGKVITLHNLRFLGVDIEKINNLETKNLIQDGIDIVITHTFFDRLSKFLQFNPKIIICGHSGGGIYLIKNTLIILTQLPLYSIIKMKSQNIYDVFQYWQKSRIRYFIKTGIMANIK